MATWLMKQLSRIGLGGKEVEGLAEEAAPADVPLSVLLVDDTPENLQVLMETLKPLGHKLLAAKSGEQALKIAERSKPALVLLDVMMPEMDGYEVCRRLKADSELARSAVIFCSALDDIGSKVEGLKLGAVDFITKPFEPEEVVARVGTHLAVQQLAHSLTVKNASLARELAVAGAEKSDALKRLEWMLKGSSAAIKELRKSITSAAQTSEHVLLRGTANRGAEAVARSIHQESSRRDRPFIICDAGQMVTTGAIASLSAFRYGPDEKSRLQLADGGTLYVEQVERFPREDQKDLLKYLKNEDERDRPDVRIIVSASPDEATWEKKAHRLLRSELDPQQIVLPSLSERKTDITPLAEHIGKRQAKAVDKPYLGFAADSMKRLLDHDWSGDLRELEDVIARSLALGEGDEIEVDANLLIGGRRIGGYRLQTKLGAGGFGEVWKGRHELLARPAAIKLILADVSAEMGAVERFRREAAATAQLTSPHTVTLYDFGLTDEGNFYYVMELLEGKDLHDIIESVGLLAPEHVAQILVHACRSLSEAHARDMVHRDLKPSNLFASKLGDQCGVIKILDFGLVRRMDGTQARLTHENVVIGTPEYIAPESAMGGVIMDGRTDIYSLCATAWELLCGKPPFYGGSAMSILMKHLETPLPNLDELHPDVPPVLKDLLTRGLAKEVQGRPTAKEVCQELMDSGLPQEWTDRRAEQWWEAEIEDGGF